MELRSDIAHLGVVLLTTIVIFSSSIASANPAAARTFTLDGRLYNSTALSSPLLDANVVMNVKIFDPSGGCLLYEEEQITSTYSTNGYFNVKVGSAPSDSKRAGSDPNNAMAQVFQNNLPIASAGCPGYTPTSGDGRRIRITVSPSSGGTEVLAPDIEMDSVPMAMVAESVQGLDRSRMLEMGAGSLTQTNVTNVFSNTNYPKLTALLGGTSTDYVRVSGTTGAAMPSYTMDPAGVAAGQVWLDTTTNQLKFHNGLSVQAISTGTMGGGGITSLGGLTAASQSFAVGVAGTSPAFSSSGATHTLNIPMASAVGVTGGLISKSDYDLFSNKLTPALSTGYIYVGDATNAAVGVLPSGDVSVTSAGVFSLATSGVTAGTYPKVEVDSKGRVIAGYALSSTDIPGLAASHITTGTFDLARLPSNVVLDGGNTTASTMVIGTNGSQRLDFKTNNVTTMSLDSTGNVGIGSTTPSSKFSVYSLDNTTSGSKNLTHFNYRIQPSGSGTGTYWGTKIDANYWANNSTTGIVGGLDATATHLLGSSAGLYGVQGQAINSTTNSIPNAYGGNFVVSNATTGTITSAIGVNASVTAPTGVVGTGYGVYVGPVAGTSTFGIYQSGSASTNYFAGNVGIGTASPQNTLDVMGSMILGDNKASGVIKRANINFDAYSTSTDHTMMGALSRSADAQLYIGNHASSARMPFNFISFHTGTNHQDTNTMIEAMRINGTGQVGIGTITPSTKLHVTGAILAGDDATCAAGKYGAIRVNSDTLQVCLATNSWSSLSTSGATGTVTQITAGTGLDGGTITTTGTIALATTGVTAAAYPKVTVDVYGRVVTGSTLAASDIPDLDGAKIASGTLAVSRLPSNVILDGGNSIASGTLVIGTTSNHQLALATNNSPKLFLGTNGNVGLGTSSPTYDLTFEGNSNRNFGIDTANAGAIGSWLTVRAGHAGSGSNLTGGTLFLAAGASRGTGKSTITMRVAPSGASGSNMNGTVDAMSIVGNSSGGANVSIGTLLNPVVSLQVNGAILAGDDATCAAGKYGAIRVNSDTLQVCLATNAWSTLSTGSGTPSGSSGSVQFNSGGTFGASSTFAWDAGNGRLGIGTASPMSPLHVAGSSGGTPTVSADLIIQNDSTVGSVTSLHLAGGSTGNAVVRFGTRTTSPGRIFYGINTGAMAFETANSERMRIDSVGNVGIGTQSPTRRLDVVSPNNASSSISVSTSNSDILQNDIIGGIDFVSRDSDLATPTVSATIQAVAQGTLHSSTRADADLVFKVVGNSSTTLTERMRLGRQGELSIGTADTTGILNLRTPSTSRPTIKMLSNNGNIGTSADQIVGGIDFYSDDLDANQYVAHIRAITLGNHAGPSAFPTGLSFATGQTTATEAMRIIANGSVGIGTTSPTTRLQVAGAILAGYNATCDNTKYGAIRVNANTLQVCLITDTWSTISDASTVTTLLQDADGDTKVHVEKTPDEDAIRMDVKGTEVISIVGSGGGGGVNTVTLNVKNGATSSSSHVRLSNTAGSEYGFVGYDGSNMYIQGSGTYEFAIKTNGNNERLRVNSTGQVGIGTTTPDQLLTVAGNIRATGAIVGGAATDADALSAITVDFTNTNAIRATGASAACGTLNVTNVAAGGSYNLTIPNATATCSTIQLNGSTANVRLPPSYTSGAAVTGVVYSFLFDGTDLWMTAVNF